MPPQPEIACDMTDTTAPLDLASGFAPATYEKWRQLVDKALKGADFDKKLVAKTADGLRIEPLYTRADTLPGAQARFPARRRSRAARTRRRRISAGRSISASSKPTRRRQQGHPRRAGGRRQRRRAADRRARAERHQDRQRRRRGGDAARRLRRLRADPARRRRAGLEAARHYLEALAALKPKPAAPPPRG